MDPQSTRRPGTTALAHRRLYEKISHLHCARASKVAEKGASGELGARHAAGSPEDCGLVERASHTCDERGGSWWRQREQRAAVAVIAAAATVSRKADGGTRWQASATVLHIVSWQALQQWWAAATGARLVWLCCPS